MSKYQVEANCTNLGIYEAESEQEARDLCAMDAGYQDKADMERELRQKSELVAWEVK